MGYQWGLAYGIQTHIGLYATAGSATALLVTRLAALIWTISRDFMQK